MVVDEHDPKYLPLYAVITGLLATRSKAERKQVGALLVTPDGILIPSWNGTVRGSCNACEDETGLTKPTVVHAEMGVLKKALVAGVSVKGSILICNYSPCINCAVQLTGLGLKKLYYMHEYKDLTGIQILRDTGVIVESYDEAIMSELS